MKQITSLNTLKFIAAVFIVLFHTQVKLTSKSGGFWCASLAVEIFFVLSGFFMAKAYEKIIATQNNVLMQCETYCANRFKRLWPEYIFAMLVSIILRSLFDHVKAQPLGLNVIMLSGIGGVPNILNGSWYVAVAFWGGCFLVCLSFLERERAKVLILPALAFLCLFFMINNKKPFSRPYEVIGSGLLSKGMVRGVLGMIIGINTYWICEKLSRCKDKLNQSVVSVVLLIGEIVSVVALLYMMVFRHRFGNSGFNIYFYAAFLIGLLYFQKEKLLRFLSWKIWEPFARISYMLYLTHMIVVIFLKKYCQQFISEHILAGYLISLISSLVFAFVCYYLFNQLKLILKKIVLKKQ